MKLYLFQSGTIITKKHLLMDVPVSDNVFEVPVPFFLIVHPKGNVLFDTGQPMSAVQHSADGDFIPAMNENNYVTAQLTSLGLQMKDISHIVLSHPHSDHAGGLEAFRRSTATCYIQKEELEYAENNDILKKYSLHWHILNGQLESCHDFLGDGKIKIIFTPGHTPGHQSLLLDSDKSGRMLLASDRVYLDEIITNSVMPRNFSNCDDKRNADKWSESYIRT